MDDLLREFVGETLDMMEEVSSDLVTWEANPTDRGSLDRIFRTVHTAKGSSGFFDLPRVSAIAHAAENVLDVLRSRKRDPDGKSVAAILSAFDQIRMLVQSIAATGSEPVGDDSALVAALADNVRLHDRAVVAEEVAGDSYDSIARQGVSPIVPLEWRSVRVPLALLDEVMAGFSDLVLARNEVALQLRARGVDLDNMAAFERFYALLGGLRGSISQMRMVPLRQMFAPMPRLLRQLCDELGKKATLETYGGEVEIDREVIEALRDPIVHILRNAIGHGVENEAARADCGKSAEARISIGARQSGNRILISIEDDGSGLNEAALIERVVAAGHYSHDQALALSGAQVTNLIFLPGLSTASSVTDISGRGVGMDVVKANVEKLGGTVGIENRPGQGMSVIIDVPMTLTIISALAIEVGGQGFAIPRSVVDEVVLVSNDAVQLIDAGGAQMVRVRGRMHALVHLEALLGQQTRFVESEDRALILCRLTGSRSFALSVPDIRDHDELVIKPLPPMLASIGLYNGFSLPDSGRPMLVLDIEGIAKHAAVERSGVDSTEQVDENMEHGRGNMDRWLCFTPWGRKTMSAVPMSTVDRLVDVAHDQLQLTAGRIVACINGQLTCVESDDFAIPQEGSVRMICVSLGDHTSLIPCRDIAHLAPLTMQLPAPDRDSIVVGLAMHDNNLVEMIDVSHMLNRPSAASRSRGGGATTKASSEVTKKRRANG